MTDENKQPFFDSGNLLTFIYSRRKQLIIVAILAIVCSTVVSYLLPEKFKATVTIFPSQNNNLSRAFLSDKSDETKDFLAFGEDHNAEQMLQVLKSDDLMYALEKKFDLYKYYKIDKEPSRIYLLKGEYADMFVYDITQYESLEITVYDKSGDKAAMMANEAVHLADSIFQNIIKQRARAAYAIVKNQYDSTLMAANKLEDSMNFYRNQGILAWDAQIKEYTRGYTQADLKGDGVMENAMNDKIKTFQQYGKGYWIIANELENNFIWLKQLKQAYMQAKVNAEQTIPAFFVADKAIPPDRKVYPVRGLVVIGGTIAALFFSLLLLLIMNRLSQGDPFGKTIKKK